MYARASAEKGTGVPAVVSAMRREAETIRNEDVEVCRRIGENGLTLLKKGQGILTHCNAGRLACVRYGTATAPIYLGQREDMLSASSPTRPGLCCRERGLPLMSCPKPVSM